MAGATKAAPPQKVTKPVMNGESKLHIAAFEQDIEGIKKLLKGGADIAAKTTGQYGGHTPLHYASANGHLAVVQLLLEKGAPVDAATDNSKWTPLHRAARWGHNDVVKALLAAGASKEAKDYEDRTPYDLAVKYDMDDTVPLVAL